MTMSNEQVKTVSIDGVEHNLDLFTDEQKTLLMHVMSLDQSLEEVKFRAVQLSVSRDAFIKLLKESLNAPKES
jgi:hypothetical protein